MTSKAADVDSYIAELPADRRAAVERLRRLCKRNLKGFEEAMEYGLPAYKRHGAVEVALASQKQYIALYVLKKDVMDEFRNAFAGLKAGKGCIRFTKPDQIDFKLVKRLLSRAAESSSAPC